MCTNGINTGQFEQMIEQIDDHVRSEERRYGIQIESREGSYTVIHILIRTIRKEEQEGQDAQNRSS